MKCTQRTMHKKDAQLIDLSLSEYFMVPAHTETEQE